MIGSETRSLAAVVCLFACGYGIFGVSEHWRFSSSYDLAIFDQALWHLSRFEPPASSVSGFSNILADHFYPILVLLTPLYWIAPAPETLIVAQALLLAASIAPVFFFLRRRLAYGPALALSAAYGFFWGLQQTAASDFHEMAFAPLFVATAIEAMDRKGWKLFWTACFVLLLVKEDLVPVLTVLGVYLALIGEPKRGAFLFVSSLLAFALIVRVLIPGFSESGTYTYGGAYAEVVKKPWTIPAALVTPVYKLRTLFFWFAPFLFLSLRSPFSVLLVPLALERFLSASPPHWGTAFHYSAPVAPIVAMSAGDGLARIAGGLKDDVTRRRLVVWAAGISVVLSAVLPGRQPLWRLLVPARYVATRSTQTGYRALTVIPPEASVVAQAALLPHLSQRHELHVFTPDSPDAEFIVASATVSPWPSDTYDELGAAVNDRRRRGYAVVFEEDGWIVLKRPVQSGLGNRRPRQREIELELNLVFQAQHARDFGNGHLEGREREGGGRLSSHLVGCQRAGDRPGDFAGDAVHRHVAD
jgi:uncharacterized membrane protein